MFVADITEVVITGLERRGHQARRRIVDATARAAKGRARLATTPDGVQESIVDSTVMEWIPLSEGEWFKPLGFGPGGWRRLLLRLSPGVVVPRHRHRGEVHAFNLAGYRQDRWAATK